MINGLVVDTREAFDEFCEVGLCQVPKYFFCICAGVAGKEEMTSRGPIRRGRNYNNLRDMSSVNLLSS